jgi:hypothetical protein
MMKNLGAVFAIQMMLLGCASIPHGGDIKSIISDYDAKIEFAQASISYAQCLDNINIPVQLMKDPENQALQKYIPQLTDLILKEKTVSEQSDQAKRSCVVDAPHNLICPRLLVTYPSFKTFIDESIELQNSLKTKLLAGADVLTSNDPEAAIIKNHGNSSTIGDMFSLEPTPVRRYVLTSYRPDLSIDKLASRISKLALQASYFSNELDYNSIYECSKINDKYDSRFNGMGDLPFAEAQASVDFSTMTLNERKVSSWDKAEEAYNRYDDAKRTIKTLEKLF